MENKDFHAEDIMSRSDPWVLHHAVGRMEPLDHRNLQCYFVIQTVLYYCDAV